MFRLFQVCVVFGFSLVGTMAANPKRGIAFTGHFASDIHKAENSVVSWQYGWAVAAPKPLIAGMAHVPMQRSREGIKSFKDAVLAQRSKAILGFNEPDIATQANMSPSEAASLWLSYIQPLKAHGILLGAPAVSSALGGQPWLHEFIAACKGCTFDFIPVHWYGDGTKYFEKYLRDFHAAFPYPLWVTEYGSTSTDRAVIQKFMTETVEYMDTLSYVQRYSWFLFGRPSEADGLSTSLLDANGNLNSLGKAYLSS